MTEKWPSFVTIDLGDSPGDDAEILRRWKEYDRRMKALIAAGGVHQDAEGWWVEDATGELIGPDPELERPRTEDELARFRPFEEALPDLHASIQRARPPALRKSEAPGNDPPRRRCSGEVQGDRKGLAGAHQRGAEEGEGVTGHVLSSDNSLVKGDEARPVADWARRRSPVPVGIEQVDPGTTPLPPPFHGG